MRRREVLKAAGGLTGVALLSGARVRANTRPTALVVGSGIAGLSAAYDLLQAGFHVSIMEKESIPGGRMVNTWVGPRYLNQHAGGVLTAYREMFALGDEVGVNLHGDIPYDESLIDNGHGLYNHALRFHFTEVMNVPGLSEETKQKLPQLVPDLARYRSEVDPCYIVTGVDYDVESLEGYFKRVLGKEAGQEIIDYWIDPVCDAWGSLPEMSTCVANLSWLAQQDAEFNIPHDGIGVLTRRLAELVDIRYDTTVMRIGGADAHGRHRVHYLTAEGDRQSVAADIVVCAVEGKYVPHLLEEQSRKQRELLEATFFTKAASVCYLLKEEYAPGEFVYGRYIGRHPDEHKRRIYYWGANPQDWADRDKRPSVEVDLARREHARWLESGLPLQSYGLRLLKPFHPVEPHMIDDIVVLGGDDLVDMPVGYVKKMAAVIGEQESRRRGLYLCGEYLGAPHTGGACASGRNVARNIIGHWT